MCLEISGIPDTIYLQSSKLIIIRATAIYCSMAELINQRKRNCNSAIAENAIRMVYLLVEILTSVKS